MARKTPWLMPDVPRADFAGQLGELPSAKKHADWTDGTVSIPKGRSARRAEYEKRFLAEVMARYGGAHARLTPIRVDARHVRMTNAVVNWERYGMYRRMLRGGDAVSPILVEANAALDLMVVDGNHRTQAARDTKRYRLRAFLREQVSLMAKLQPR